jgi:hypothetical protein
MVMAVPENGRPSDAAVPVSVTVLLFADTFAPVIGAGDKGTVSYATGVSVVTEILARQMISVDLIHLQNGGAIEVDPFVRKKILFFSAAEADIRIIDDQVLRSSAGRIAQAIAADKKARQGAANVRAIIARAYPDSLFPYKTIVQIALDDAVELGYLELERNPGLRGIAHGLAGQARTIPRMERIRALQADAEVLAAEWTDFSKANPNGARQLQEFVTVGIDYCRKGPRYG